MVETGLEAAIFAQLKHAHSFRICVRSGVNRGELCTIMRVAVNVHKTCLVIHDTAATTSQVIIASLSEDV